MPYAKEPLDCANDPTVRLVALMWASQTTKTTALENVICYFICSDPSPILLIQPTVEMAQAWSKERLNATIRDTPALRDVINAQRSRDSGNTIQLKTFPGGNLAIIGANAPAGLAGRPRRVVLADEVDRYPISAGTEGDPVSLAIRRTESFWNSVIYLTSTPTTKGASRIESEYEQTDKRKWFVPCPKCEKEQTLKWAQVRWTDPQGFDASYVCDGCGCRWSDAERISAIRKGTWKPTAPFNGKRGYHLNGIYSPFKAKRGFKNRLHQMVADFVEAKKGGIEQLKTWTNTFLAETWEEESEKMEYTELAKRGEDETYTLDSLPEQIICLLAGVDVQKDRLEVEIAGLGLDDESWGVQSQQIFGDTEQGEVWQDLAQLLGATFKREDGAVLKVSAAAIDMRHKPKRVREFVRTCGLARVYPVYGLGGDSPIMVTTRFNKHHKLRVYGIATKIAKDSIFAKLRVEEPGPRYCHFPKGHGYNEGYFQQLTAEVLKTKYLHGFPTKYYEKIRDRNEALDIRVYWEAAIDILKPNLTAIQRQLKAGLPGLPDKVWTPPPDPAKPVPLDKLTPQPTPKARVRPLRPGGGFVGGWRK